MKEIHHCLIFFPARKESTRPMLSIRILFANYDIITYLLSMPFCAEHFISMKHWILATFNIIKKKNLTACVPLNVVVTWNYIFTTEIRPLISILIRTTSLSSSYVFFIKIEVVVFSLTSKNISVISWRSVLLVEETGRTL
jgi:hypothetical protein